MSKSGTIAFSYFFNQEGLATKIEDSQATREAIVPDLQWTHLYHIKKSTANWLRSEVNHLDNLAVNALIAEETRPRIVEMERGLLIILRGIAESKLSDKEMVSIRLWIDGERVISIQKKSMIAVLEIQQQIESGEIIIHNSGEFLSYLINFIASDISKIVYSLGEKIDEIEEEILKNRNLKFRETILNARSTLTIYRRYLAPQREVISKLRNCSYNWISASSKRYLQENYDNFGRVIDEIDEVLSRAKILHDELSHALNEKISRNTFKFTVVATIFMPLTFITGLFGMNFTNIPGLQNEYGFYIVSLLMLVIAMIQLSFFRKKDWF